MQLVLVKVEYKVRDIVNNSGNFFSRYYLIPTFSFSGIRWNKSPGRNTFPKFSLKLIIFAHFNKKFYYENNYTCLNISQLIDMERLILLLN